MGFIFAAKGISEDNQFLISRELFVGLRRLHKVSALLPAAFGSGIPFCGHGEGGWYATVR